MNHATAHSLTATAARLLPDLQPAAVNSAALSRLPEQDSALDTTGMPELASVRMTAMSFRNMHQHGDLLPRYLEARKNVFVDRLNWHVPHVDGMEFDQYDTPFCRWVVLHEFGKVIGGVRLASTTAQCGIYTYMLRDAQQGHLADIPTDVLFFKAPVEQGIWEASRFFISDAVEAKRRLPVQSLLFKAMNDVAVDNGATFILGIVPYIWARWARRLGITATPIGAKFDIEGTKSQAVLFNTRAL